MLPTVLSQKLPCCFNNPYAIFAFWINLQGDVTTKNGASFMNPSISPNVLKTLKIINHENKWKWLALPDRRQLAIGDYCVLDIMDIFSGKKIKRFWNSGHVADFASLPEGQLAVGLDDNTIKIYNTAFQCVQILKCSRGLNDLHMLSDGRLAAYCNGERIVEIWNIHSGECEKIIKLQRYSPISLATLPNKQLAVGWWNDTVDILNIESGECFQILNIKYLHSLVALPNGKLISASRDGEIVVWHQQSGQWEREKTLTGCGMCRLVVLPNDQLATLTDSYGGNNIVIKIWNTRSWECEKTLSPLITRLHIHTFKSNAFASLSNGAYALPSHEALKILSIPGQKSLKDPNRFFNRFSAEKFYKQIEDLLMEAEKNPNSDRPLFKIYFLLKKHIDFVKHNLNKKNPRMGANFEKITTLFKENHNKYPSTHGTYDPYELLPKLDLPVTSNGSFNI